MAKSGPLNFHLEAKSLLEKVRIHEMFDVRDLLQASPGFTQEQNFKRFEFSDLPLTLVRGEHCFVDVYFWRRRPTTIHNHHFTGAFQCLMGLNVESEFAWNHTRKLSKFHSLGNLEEKQTVQISPGMVREIDLQDKFIHQSHHHADLTVNLCFRTPDLGGKNLSNFLLSGLKIEKDERSLREAELLYRLTNFDDIDPKIMKISKEIVFNFLLNTLGTTENPRVLRLQKYFGKWVRDELDVDIAKLLKSHDMALNKIQERYN